MRRIVKNTFGFTIAFVLAMGLLELFLRFSGSSTPSFVVNDPRFGLAFRPNTPFVYFTEGLYVGGVNKFGYLGPGYPPEKPAGVLRVALLGDSFIEGFQLLDRSHLRRIMEDELNRAGPRRAEVMNFGFSGSNLAMMYDYNKEFVAQFHPDVALFFIGQDDMKNDSSELGPRFSAVNDSVRVDLSFAQSAGYKRHAQLGFIRRLALYSLVRNVFRRAQESDSREIVLGKVYGWFKPETRKQAQVSKADTSWPLDKAIFDELAAWNRSGETRIAVVEKRPLDAAYRDYIRSVGIPIYDLQPVLKQLEQQGIRPNYWPVSGTVGHWNHSAHTAIGRYLAPRVLELVAPSDSLPGSHP